MTQSILDQATEHAYMRLSTVDGNAWNLPEPMQTLVIVDTSQGIIDNGGLEYFFESDFPKNPPYSLFVAAFRRIGADAVATCIEVSSGMFPFSQPHLYAAKRKHWIDSIKENDAHEFVLLSDRACGDKTVFQKLAEYVERNRHAFGTV